MSYPKLLAIRYRIFKLMSQNIKRGVVISHIMSRHMIISKDEEGSSQTHIIECWNMVQNNLRLNILVNCDAWCWNSFLLHMDSFVKVAFYCDQIIEINLQTTPCLWWSQGNGPKITSELLLGQHYDTVLHYIITVMGRQYYHDIACYFK